MKVHLKHRFSDVAHLELIEVASDAFHVSYTTMEGVDEDGREQWFCNNTDVYTSFAEAKRGFNLRRDSAEPFQPLNKRKR